MGWCFTGILLGQVMQRFKLDVCGGRHGNHKNTCLILTILTFLANFLVVSLATMTGAGAGSKFLC
jgi:hypothetical protein